VQAAIVFPDFYLAGSKQTSALRHGVSGDTRDTKNNAIGSNVEVAILFSNGSLTDKISVGDQLRIARTRGVTPRPSVKRRAAIRSSYSGLVTRLSRPRIK
jgi:hypothetical protein